MKTGKSLTKKILAGIVSVFFLSFVALSFSCNKDDNNTPQANNDPYTLSGNASASQMVPKGDTTLTGTGTLSGSYNPVNGVLIYTTTWTGLTGAPIAGGIYNGAAGSVGTPIDTTWTFDSTFTATGSFTDTVTLTGDQPTQLTAGAWYYMLKTEAHPEGEIRGQISATR
jgi:hypothetical protein